MTPFAYKLPIRALWLGLLSLLLVGCQIDSEPKSELEKIRERGVLRVGTLNNPLSYYIGPDGPTGLDYELAREFAKELGVKLEMKPAYRLSSLFPALKNGEVDIIAAGLSQSEERLKDFRAGPAYYYVSQQVVYKKGDWRPRSFKQLVERQQTLLKDNPELAFIRALDTRLPRWTPLFQKYSAEFDWRLVAALAYQESHWNPYAKSPTGVRGLMMLTLPTARSVGVSDRLDPEQSIRGGVEYLRRMMERVPDSISEHEKIWFALASYNIGYGHMMDARRLTKSQGADPDSWADVKDRLPQLQQKKYFTQTRYGYARGDEARNYVENIRRYYQSIIGHLEQRQLATGDESIEDLTVIALDEEFFNEEANREILDEEAEALESESLENSESSAEPSAKPSTESKN